MASSQPELLDDVRKFTGYEEFVLDEAELRTCLDRAKGHIASRKSLDASQAEWYSNPQLEEAVFWFTTFLTKIATGELDSPAGAIENVELERFNSYESEWYQRAQQALRAIEVSGSGSSAVGSIERQDRVYGGDDGVGL